MNQQTVGNFLYDCLSKEGIAEIFCVPGDYNFSLLNALEEYPGIDLINCCNELNAGYAADAYARVRGIGAFITTFGVGELSACNAMAGAYCENVPVIHIIGGPKTQARQQHKKMHHTLLDGDFDVFQKLYGHISAYTAGITPENAALEIPAAIRKAKETKKPVYLLFATDIVNKPIIPREADIPAGQTSPTSLQAALRHINQLLGQSQNPVLLSGAHVSRYALELQVQQLAEKVNLPVATVMTGKGSFDESRENFTGLYAGSLGSAEVRSIVETSDCILSVGNMWSDYDTGSFTAELNPLKLIDIRPNSVKAAMAVYENVLMQDLLNELLAGPVKRLPLVPAAAFPYDNDFSQPDEPVSSEYYYPRFQKLLRENDILIADAGAFQFGSAQLRLAKGTSYITQGGWGSIGYGIPAALGACIAATNRRVILLVGDGSAQISVQELSSLLANGCRPIIFLVSNGEYTIEKYLNTGQEQTRYNDISRWDYGKLIEAFGGNAFTAKVRTNRELDAAISRAEVLCMEKLCLIEMFAPAMDAPDIVHKLNAVLEQTEKQQ